MKKVKEAVIKFLDDYLFQEIKTIMVLDWKIDDLQAEVKNIPNTNIDFSAFTKSIEGRSFELAAAIALISRILDIKISTDYIFSGSVESDGNHIKLLLVDRIRKNLIA
ncbi:MAG: hypothetical protein IPN57_07950 [Ignavibacteria bacterium]|nr:hypothetical protein [Ignavibacteria bacterium]